MSDEEIEKYNDSFMMIEGLTNGKHYCVRCDSYHKDYECPKSSVGNNTELLQKQDETKEMSMKDRTLCLYWPEYDKVLNIRKIADGFEFEIKDRKSEVIVISTTQIKQVKEWINDNT